MLIEIAQHGVALIDGNVKDARGESAIDVERLLSRAGMRPNHRVLGPTTGRPHFVVESTTITIGVY